MDKIVEEEAPNPTRIIFLPYMMGERSPIWNSDARGVFFGLDMNTKRGQVMRAILEGTSYGLRDNIEIAKKNGVSIEKVRMTGGCASSDIWLKIKASVINLTIEVPEVTVGAPAGLAIMMMPVIGEYPDIGSAVEECVKIKKTVHPDPDWVKYYDEMFPIFKKIYENTKDELTALAAVKPVK